MNPIFILKNVLSKRWCVFALAFLFSANLTLAQDDCNSAVALSCGDVITGSNEDNGTETLPACGLVFPGQTVWYSIQGTGGEITATTCSSNTDFDSQIGVFSGSCGSLSCVTGNNNDIECPNNRQATVSWDSDAGTTYYIVVAGVSGSDGNYELSVDCEAVGPENDDCANAESISCGDIVLGSTETATNADGPGFCGTSLTSAPGVWYVLSGDGSSVTASLCGSSYDTKIGVFEGSCGSLSCVTGNDDSCGLQSQVSFSTSAGTDYYIYVTGFSTGSGDFRLSVSCAGGVANDDCSDAIHVDCGETVSGSTDGASPESVGFCGTSLTSAGGVWYYVEGTGADITVTTCNAGTDYDTKLGVFSGSCGALVCEGGDDDDACPFSSLRSRVTWTSEAGTDYYILVTGFGSNTGNFELSVECEELPPTNNDCANAVGIACGDTVSGNTETDGSVHEFGTSCGTSQSENISTAPGLWYVFEGNNTLVNLTTCNEGTDYDTKIAVFAGSCEGLVCEAINDNDDDCGLHRRFSTVEFPAFEGTTYYVYVTGHQGSDGNFVMTVDCSAINDVCERALDISCGETVEGNTDEAGPDSTPFCGTSNFGANGVWYQTTGTGLEMTASLCGSLYDTKLWIFEGTCESLVCVGGNDDFCGLDSQVSWDSDDGTTYYILVSGFSSSSSGDYILSLDCEEDDPGGDNDSCAGATEIFCGDSVIGATDDGATADDGLAFCGTSLTSAPGRWHKFTGLGDNVTVTTCNNGTNYDTKIGVFTNCGSLVCVGGNDDGSPDGSNPNPDCVIPETGSSFNRASTLTFAAMNGTTYYIYVTGFLANTGTYELSIDCNNNLTEEEPAGLAQENQTHLNGSLLGGSDKAVVGNFYPNPAEFGTTNLEIYSPVEGLARIQLFDNMGRLAHNVEVELYGGVNTVALQVRDLPIGTYFANIQMDNFVDRKKLIIAK